MAHDGIEIEIKIPVDEEAMETVRNKIKEMGKFVKSSKHIDDYYTSIHRDFIESWEWLSVRRRGDKSILNYKCFKPRDAEVKTHCDEWESEVVSAEEVEKILKALDMEKLITVEKDRDVFVFEDQFEIALDRVSDLGSFVEIESLKDFGGVDVTRDKLVEFAESLGMDPSNIESKGYPMQLLVKEGLIK